MIPVLRQLIVPDPGYVLLDMDLAAADAQVVAWEAGDEALKSRFRSGDDIHLANARDLWGQHITAKTTDSRGILLRNKIKLVHAINYKCGWRTLADHMQEPAHVAKAFIAGWLGKHPLIRAWQRRILIQLEQTRTVHNAWGFRRIYTDRLGIVLPQALAWICQSTIAITINKILLAIDEAEQRRGLPCFILLQDHDNLICQIPQSCLQETLDEVMELSRVPIPFPDPLIIPATFKLSDRSWADVVPAAQFLTGSSPIAT